MTGRRVLPRREETAIRAGARANPADEVRQAEDRWIAAIQANDNQLRLLHVWVKQAGAWVLVAHQTTRLAS